MKKLSLFFGLVAMTTITLVSYGQSPKQVTIGNMVWMAENLNMDKFRNGDPIPHAKTNEEWVKAGKNEQPAWCYYNNDPANGTKYGKLYNYYAVNDPRGLAPKGWRIPFAEIWDWMADDFLDGKFVAGTKMKSSSGWGKNDKSTNSSGFSALPGGIRKANGSFEGIGQLGQWWSQDMDTVDDGYYRLLITDDRVLYRGKYQKEAGYSVRCLIFN